MKDQPEAKDKMAERRLRPERDFTVGDVLRFLAPGADLSTCPDWPPDVYGIAGSLLRRTGTYVRAVELTDQAEGLLPKDWPAKARQLGRAWRAAVNSSEDKWEVPKAVAASWNDVWQAADVPIEAAFREDALVAGLLVLCGAADEACLGVGSRMAEPDLFHMLAQVRLAVSDDTSLTWRVPPSRVSVLPKQHTPQRGMTLRSLTHHLALLPATDVRVSWRSPIERPTNRDLDLFNLLLLPWPLQVAPSSFRLERSRNEASRLSSPYRYFSFDPPEGGNGQSEDFTKSLRDYVQAARACSGHLDAIVFPELALSWREYLAAEAVASEEDVILVAGVRITGKEAEENLSQPANVCFYYLPSTQQADRTWTRFAQRKHHRWCLDRSQVLQYGLGGVLPASCNCWELTDIGARELTFVTLGSWLTVSALICEDLARQDPVSEIVRTVGPNLLIALLMDGPQLRGRWASRYASVLAEDPGCSVLTLTSLGMAAISRPTLGKALGDQPNRNRVVGLWRDVMYGEQELELPVDHDAAVLSLAREVFEEFTADGRGDGRNSHFPVFAGFTPLPRPKAPEGPGPVVGSP